jgi:hypothetical protein
MMSQSYTALPKDVWTAFFGLVVVGAVMVALSEVGVVSSLGFALFLVVALAAFVLWAVLRLDPRGLAELALYKRKQDG